MKLSIFKPVKFDNIVAVELEEARKYQLEIETGIEMYQAQADAFRARLVVQKERVARLVQHASAVAPS